MSTFNNFEFNNILFGEMDLSAPAPFRVVYISASISGSSTISFYNENVVNIVPFRIEGSSSVYIEPQYLIGLSADIYGESAATVNIGAIYSATSSISSGSTFAAENFLRARIDTDSQVSAFAVADRGITASILGEAQVTANSLTGTFHLQSDITGTTTVTTQLKYFGGLLPASVITGESTVTAVTLFLFKRLEGATIGGESTVSVNASKNVYLTARIDGSSTLNTKVAYSASITANIESGSHFLKLVDVASDAILGNSYVTAELTAPQQFRNTGNRRRVTFIFEVDKPKSNVSIIDNHYKLFNFYNSLANVNQTLNYVRRTAGLELKGYKIDNANHRAWTSDADLFNLKPGDRGIVKKNATGMFTGKDGYFALYKGPLVVDNETEVVE